jgi:pyruvate formate-lyase activating enzyme-like uncharacterized protein
MEAKYSWLNSLMNKNKVEFAKWPEINWANYYKELDHNTNRSEIISHNNIRSLFKDTKPFYNHISKGCQICAEGKWSCLFITNMCNANCFYCPTSQNLDEKPSTQSIDFQIPSEYAEYVSYFGFKGVAFSGGEPLLYFDRTKEYLAAVHSKSGDDIYTWMYTNGILADKNKLKQLADLNLNEIRFDIGATGFSLDKVKIAKGIIPNITIEIPSVPEKKELIINMLPEMIKAGVTNLNLHQLRLTQYNASKLNKRNYTILSAERPIVLESEMAALKIIEAAKLANIDIGINYCAFHYKNRFQKAGYRKLITNKLFPDYNITENGYIREYDGKSLKYRFVKFTNNDKRTDDTCGINVGLTNYIVSFEYAFIANDLSKKQKQQIDMLLVQEPLMPPDDPLLFKIWQYEYIERGLRDW